MRTTIDLPDDLLARAQAVSGSPSKRETVIAALQELIRKSEREGLRRLAGKLDLDLDLDRARKRRRA